MSSFHFNSKNTFRTLLVVTIGILVPTIFYYESKNQFSRGFIWNTFQRLETKANYKCFSDFDYRYMLNDSITGYYKQSLANGIPQFIKSKKQLNKFVRAGKLVEVIQNEYYVLDTMYYSHPFLTPESSQLLDSIGRRFHEKLENTNLACAQLNVTSLLRTVASVERLRRRNRNSIRNSAHLHGTSFDISYRTFYFNGVQVDESSSKYLKDALIETIWEFKKKGLCWATFEYWQTCIHVVRR
jgi:hypothetical protein